MKKLSVEKMKLSYRIGKVRFQLDEALVAISSEAKYQELVSSILKIHDDLIELKLKAETIEKESENE